VYVTDLPNDGRGENGTDARDGLDHVVLLAFQGTWSVLRLQFLHGELDSRFEVGDLSLYELDLTEDQSQLKGKGIYSQSDAEGSSGELLDALSAALTEASSGVRLKKSSELMEVKRCDFVRRRMVLQQLSGCLDEHIGETTGILRENAIQNPDSALLER